MTLVCDCEVVMTTRPITYISDDPNGTILREQAYVEMPSCDDIDNFSSCMRRIQNLKGNLRQWFWPEYLGQLTYSDNRSIKVGQIVLTRYNSSKQVEWPVRRVIELLSRKDELIR